MCTKIAAVGRTTQCMPRKNVPDLPIEESIFLAPEYGVFFFAFFCMKLHRNDTQVSMFADFANDIFLWFNLCMDIEFWKDGESTRSLRD